MLEVAELPVDALAYLLTEKGARFASSGSLDNAVRKGIIAAGLCEPMLDEEGLPVLEKNGHPKMRATQSQHGIRKRRAEKIAKASGSVFEVMAHLSHSDPNTAPSTRSVSIERSWPSGPHCVLKPPVQSRVSHGRQLTGHSAA